MPLFTRENAREKALKGNAVRWSRPRPIPPPPEPPAIPAIVSPSIAEPQRDEFQARRLKRVREQLDRVDDLMISEDDPKRLKELADASARLSDQEFKLAGRPSPGSRRPAQERTPAAQDAGAWIVESSPAPVAEASGSSSASIKGCVHCALKGELHDEPSQPVLSIPAPSMPERLPGDVTP